MKIESRCIEYESSIRGLEERVMRMYRKFQSINASQPQPSCANTPWEEVRDVIVVFESPDFWIAKIGQRPAPLFSLFRNWLIYHCYFVIEYDTDINKMIEKRRFVQLSFDDFRELIFRIKLDIFFLFKSTFPWFKFIRSW